MLPRRSSARLRARSMAAQGNTGNGGNQPPPPPPMPKKFKSSFSLLLFYTYAGKVHASIGVCESGAPSIGSLVTKHTTTFTESTMTFSLQVLEVLQLVFLITRRREAGRQAGSHLNACIETSRGVLAPPARGQNFLGKAPLRGRNKKLVQHKDLGHCTGQTDRQTDRQTDVREQGRVNRV